MPPADRRELVRRFREAPAAVVERFTVRFDDDGVVESVADSKGLVRARRT